MTAKSFAKLIRKIENCELGMQSRIVEVPKEIVEKTIAEIQSEMDSVHENAKDIPWELLKYIETIDAEVCCTAVKGKTPKKKFKQNSAQTEENV